MVALEQSTIQNEEIKLSKAHWHWPSQPDRDLFRQQQVLPISLMAFFVFGVGIYTFLGKEWESENVHCLI